MTSLGPRWAAACATIVGFVASGFEAHMTPQLGGGEWRGFTGAPVLSDVAWAFAAGVAVFALGRFADTRPFLLMGAGCLPAFAVVFGVAPIFLLFGRSTLILLFFVLLAYVCRDLVSRARLPNSMALGAIAFGCFLLTGRFLPGPAGPQGDEPHYLLIAESLLRDGDVDLANQFRERAYAAFTSGDLQPHTAPRTPRGTDYSIHTPGVSALIAPGYAIAGYAGARAVLSLLMALAVSILVTVARSKLGEEGASFLFFAAVFGTPLPVYANSLFPDSFAAVATVLGLVPMFDPSRGRLILAAASLAALPWLHPRFLPLATILAVANAVRARSRFERFAVIGPLLFATAALLLHFQSVFGDWSLSAAYGPGFANDVSIGRAPLGILALALDRQFGLLLFAPILLIGLPGIGGAWKQDRGTAIVMGAAGAAIVGIGGSFSMWWGGASPPARFVIGAVPLLLLLASFRWMERTDARAWLSAAAGFGAGLLCLACLAPRALHNRNDGQSGLLRLLAPALDLDRFFPSFATTGGLEPVVAAIWVATLILTMLRSRVAIAGGVAALTGLALLPPEKMIDPVAATQGTLEAWSRGRIGFSGADDVTRFALDIPLDAGFARLGPGQTAYSPRFSLPAGDWALEVVSSVAPAEGILNAGKALVVDASDEALASANLVIGENTTRIEFSLPRPAQRLHIKGLGIQSVTRIASAKLVPRALR